MKTVLTALAATSPFAANAADAISGAEQRQRTNWQAIIMFLFSSGSRSALPTGHQNAMFSSDYYTAGGKSPASRTGWRLPGTIGPPPHSWGSPRRCRPPAMTA
ncbi:hypothetical protein ACNKHT_26970 [Shigella flexneri]